MTDKCDRCHLLETTLKVIQDKMLYRSVIWELIEKVLKKGKHVKKSDS